MESQTITGVELHHSWGSLRELIRRNMTLKDAPELFCFGLLKEVDIPHLIAQLTPRTVTVHDPDIQSEWDLSCLQDWYHLFGEEFTLTQ